MGDKQPHEWAEAHSPTDFYDVRITSERRAHLCRRRQWDAKLWDSLKSNEQDAMQAINGGFQVICSGLGVKTFNPFRVQGTPGNIDYGAELYRWYMEWGEKCNKQKISHAMCMDIISYGKSVREVARDRRCSRFAIRRNLGLGLGLYCELRGWV